MWKVMICDDEPEMCAQIRQSLARFTQECGAQFSIRECHSGEALLCRLEADTDLVFLDIRMEGLSGMEAARRLRKENRDVCLIFITTMTQYALEGYQVHAYGFLKKPLLYAQFRLLMLDALRSLAGKNAHHIIEGCFKGLGRALRQAVSIDAALADEIPSTKGVL